MGVSEGAPDPDSAESEEGPLAAVDGQYWIGGGGGGGGGGEGTEPGEGGGGGGGGGGGPGNPGGV